MPIHAFPEITPLPREEINIKSVSSPRLFHDTVILATSIEKELTLIISDMLIMNKDK